MLHYVRPAEADESSNPVSGLGCTSVFFGSGLKKQPGFDALSGKQQVGGFFQAGDL